MLDVLSYNEGSRKSIFFGFQLKLKKLLTRVVPARIIISSSIILLLYVIHVNSRFAESQTRPKSFIKLPHRSEG